MDGTLTFDVDAMVFVAPNPQQADKFFALIYPLDMTVWLFILISFLIVTLAFLLLANTEERVMATVCIILALTKPFLGHWQKIEDLEHSVQMQLVHFCHINR